MSKGIAILALLLTVAQSPAPVSREAANSTAHASTSVTSRSQKTPPTQSPPPANANQPPAPKGDAERQSQKNAQNSIEVTKFPSVFVNRDWVDWGVWIFSGLLVVVGFLQVLLLYGTLSTVKEQSGVLKQTLIHTHRPTIAVRNFYFSKVRGVGGLYGIKNGIEEGSFATGQFYIVNTGGTRATIREIVCQTYIGEERLPMNRPYEGNEGVKPDKL